MHGPARWKRLALPFVACAFFLLGCLGSESGCEREPPPPPDIQEEPPGTVLQEAFPPPFSEEDLARFAEETARVTPLASHLRHRYTDDLSGLGKRGYIRVLTTFNKTNFFLRGGRTFGFEYSLLHGYEAYLNEDHNPGELRVYLEFIPVPRERLIPLLVSGYGDIAAAGLTITPRRQKRVDFTIPYLRDVDEVIVANRRVRELNTLEDLSGREVFVRPGSSYRWSLERLNARFEEAGLHPVRIRMADESLETEDILEMVNAGVVPLTVADIHIALLWESVFENLIVYRDLAVRRGGKIAWAIRKDSPELKASLNAFLKTHRQGTLLGNIYLRRYFGNNRWIRDPFHEQPGQQDEPHRELFRKYADLYEFDWKLIKAVAYQESGFNQNTVSPAGAQGIMQVLPETAADPNVNIQDIHILENNIHAGVRYLAFLRDRYFSGEEIEEKDRIRFALAAYNAGPQNILRARRRAEDLGLERNRWFRNVEIAALQLVGQETVQYVSNINKYFLLFTFHEEHERRKGSVQEDALAAAPEKTARRGR